MCVKGLRGPKHEPTEKMVSIYLAISVDNDRCESLPVTTALNLAHGKLREQAQRAACKPLMHPPPRAAAHSIQQHATHLALTCQTTNAALVLTIVIACCHFTGQIMFPKSTHLPIPSFRRWLNSLLVNWKREIQEQEAITSTSLEEAGQHGVPR